MPALPSHSRSPSRNCAFGSLTTVTSPWLHVPLQGCVYAGRTRKKPVTFVTGFLHMVRLAGIEPTTPWFVAKYSIQLSYSR
jgi:hypothetical protein